MTETRLMKYIHCTHYECRWDTPFVIIIRDRLLSPWCRILPINERLPVCPSVTFSVLHLGPSDEGLSGGLVSWSEIQVHNEGDPLKGTQLRTGVHAFRERENSVVRVSYGTWHDSSVSCLRGSSEELSPSFFTGWVGDRSRRWCTVPVTISLRKPTYFTFYDTFTLDMQLCH